MRTRTLPDSSPCIVPTLPPAAPRSGLFSAEPNRAEPRPLSYWLANHPPGWVSRHSVATADPLALSGEIHSRLLAFIAWLKTPPSERWETFTRQSLSAALFNRFQLRRDRWPKRPRDEFVGLLRLPWPPGSEEIQLRLAELQTLLAPPLAVFKSVHSAVPAAGFPTAEEIALADQALAAAQNRLADLADHLGKALDLFNAGSRIHNPAPSDKIGQDCP